MTDSYLSNIHSENMSMTHNITQDISQAARWLKEGELLCYPTESVWGIGCDAYNEQAVQQILSIKNRPIDKGMIVITDSVARIMPMLHHPMIEASMRQKIIDSWQVSAKISDMTPPMQQAQTWLLPINSDADSQVIIPQWITGKHSSVAVRVIAHPLIRQLCQQLVSTHNPYGLLVSTSCNPSTKTPAKTLDEAIDYFSDKCFYLEGQTLGYTQPSQINDGISGELIR